MMALVLIRDLPLLNPARKFCDYLGTHRICKYLICWSVGGRASDNDIVLIYVSFLRPLVNALYDNVCGAHPSYSIQRYHVSTTDVLSLEGYLSQLAIAASNQRYIVENAGSSGETLLNNVVMLS
jgi:hypothetical protein